MVRSGTYYFSGACIAGHSIDNIIGTKPVCLAVAARAFPTGPIAVPFVDYRIGF